MKTCFFYKKSHLSIHVYSRIGVQLENHSSYLIVIDISRLDILLLQFQQSYKLWFQEGHESNLISPWKHQAKNIKILCSRWRKQIVFDRMSIWWHGNWNWIKFCRSLCLREFQQTYKVDLVVVQFPHKFFACTPISNMLREETAESYYGYKNSHPFAINQFNVFTYNQLIRRHKYHHFLSAV
jgi:hypothetical protein